MDKFLQRRGVLMCVETKEKPVGQDGENKKRAVWRFD